ncbi:glycosyltransferase family 2 protein [Desulfospira joergensenii]|uniref:glycosyltransferase family 2 protein n=1 Tax=Desulfospira joergensenii TaxID=53329 RepID=UPI0003B73C48|nr:glycosyltransferase family 2 protein [Desulfospira joergensenii]
MKISVIVTTYNRPDALKRVVDGLYCQTCLPHEIIIADDGSTHETRDMLESYTRRTDLPLFHVWQEDQGFRAARIRNKAILKSKGEYLILLDGDCLPSPHFISDHQALALHGHFFQGKRVIVNQKLADSFTQEDIRSFLNLVKHTFTNGISNSHHILRIPFFPSYTVKKQSGIRSCNMGLFREDAVAVNGFNHDFTGWGREDSEFVIRLTRYGLKRNENPFRAICFHLWHRENPRTDLNRNDYMLAQAAQSANYFCKNGLDTLTKSDLQPEKE